MREYHHTGIPTTTKREGETYMEGAKLFVTSVDASPNKIEWLRFEPESEMPDLLKNCAHVAFQVDDIKKEMEGQEVLIEPFNPAEGITVAFVIEDGAPIELYHEA